MKKLYAAKAVSSLGGSLLGHDIRNGCSCALLNTSLLRWLFYTIYMLRVGVTLLQ
jgi:hypothetical protein